MSDRIKSWDLRLIKYVTAELEKPFDWVTSNCGHLMAASVIACCGDEHPILEELTKRLTKEEMEATNLEEVLGRYFFRLPSILHAQRGDLMLVKREDGLEAGCVLLDGYIVGKSEKLSRAGSNVFRLPIASAAVAFRV